MAEVQPQVDGGQFDAGQELPLSATYHSIQFSVHSCQPQVIGTDLDMGDIQMTVYFGGVSWWDDLCIVRMS